MMVESQGFSGDSNLKTQWTWEAFGKAVKDYLVTKENIATDRIETQAVGALKVSTKKEWPFARKVEFLIKE